MQNVLFWVRQASFVSPCDTNAMLLLGLRGPPECSSLSYDFCSFHIISFFNVLVGTEVAGFVLSQWNSLLWLFFFFFWKISSTLVFLSLWLSAFANIFPFQPHLSSSLLSAMVLFPSLCHCLKVNYQVSNVAHEKWPVKQLREQIIYPYLMHLDSLIHSGGICLTCVRIFSASSHFLSNNSLLKPSGLLLVVFICLYWEDECLLEGASRFTANR